LGFGLVDQVNKRLEENALNPTYDWQMTTRVNFTTTRPARHSGSSNSQYAKIGDAFGRRNSWRKAVPGHRQVIDELAGRKSSA
jgi:hypothetical protein